MRYGTVVLLTSSLPCALGMLFGILSEWTFYADHLWPDIPFRVLIIPIGVCRCTHLHFVQYCQALFYIDIIVGANLTAVPVSGDYWFIS